MNELMLVITSEDWIYFPTRCIEADSAFAEFLRTCESVGINMDNVYFESYELRDSEGNYIDRRTLL